MGRGAGERSRPARRAHLRPDPKAKAWPQVGPGRGRLGADAGRRERSPWWRRPSRPLGRSRERRRSVAGRAARLWPGRPRRRSGRCRAATRSPAGNGRTSYQDPQTLRANPATPEASLHQVDVRLDALLSAGPESMPMRGRPKGRYGGNLNGSATTGRPLPNAPEEARGALAPGLWWSVRRSRSLWVSR